MGEANVLLRYDQTEARLRQIVGATEYQRVLCARTMAIALKYPGELGCG
ncbi:hypothetical protein NOR51B_1814 [Luminiphilus syltensis NOR5-1B]|uniref:Uncharacterized protein n=1 Tax=Luminiphilus syltensis NOR5-1B TaxID=565045 RepID=B8KUE5_9GAMM|nr:hypothetical protein NOR51B_1814 [Luminiphilus syltensis NOR5-1B]